LKNLEIFKSKPILLKIHRRSWWLRNRKNWVMLNAKMLISTFLTYPKQMKCIRETPASTVKHCLSLSSWLGWIKLFEIKWNWILSPITLSMSLPIVLRRTMGLKNLEESYDSLLNLGMMIEVNVLKWNGQ